jgi:hypothetical protein
VQVADIDDTITHLESLGARVASRIDDVIVFTDPATTAGVVIEWYGGRSPNDPRFGAPIPPYLVEPLLEVTHMAFGGAVVEDPAGAAGRLATLLNQPVTFVDEGAAPGSPQAGVSLGDMTFALYALPPDPALSRQLWGHAYRRPQTSSLGVRVPDLAAAVTALKVAGVPIVRQDEGSIVIHPDATGGVVLVVVEELLAGDPRHP